MGIKTNFYPDFQDTRKTSLQVSTQNKVFFKRDKLKTFPETCNSQRSKPGEGAPALFKKVNADFILSLEITKQFSSSHAMHRSAFDCLRTII